MIPVSVEWEQELWELREKPDEKKAFLEECGLKSILPRIVKVGYNVLNLSYYFTAGNLQTNNFPVFSTQSHTTTLFSFLFFSLSLTFVFSYLSRLFFSPLLSN